MDEPFQGLDYGIRMEMVAMLLAIWRREKPGVLFVTHEIDEAADRGHPHCRADRPTHHRGTVVFPPRPEGRDASSPELLELRRAIIHQITQ